MNAFKKTGGFTLVELIIVIAILAILSSVAVVGYSSYISKANDAAVLSELNNISTAATLANAQAAGITKIEVAADGTITVYADGFDESTDGFAKLFKASTGIALEKGTVKVGSEDVTVFKSAATGGKFTSKNWDNSKYAGGAVWTGEWDVK